MCKSSHSDYEKLMFHFKYSHNLNSTSPIRCVDCVQIFTLRSRFKRHVTRHHLNKQNEPINNDNIDFLDSINSLNSLPDVDMPSISNSTQTVSTNISQPQINKNNSSDIPIGNNMKKTQKNNKKKT